MSKHVKFKNGKYKLSDEMVKAIRLVFPGAKYAAMDMDRLAYAFDEKPNLNNSRFGSTGVITEIPTLYNYAGDDWKNSLIKLPVEIPALVLERIKHAYPTAKKIAKSNSGHMAIYAQNTFKIYDNQELKDAYSWVLDYELDIEIDLDCDVIELE